MRRALSFLITAGPTVEDLDPVRFLSNRATGKLGFAVAAAALAAGHRVTLIHGPVAETLIAALPRRHRGRVRRVPVRSCAQMHRAVLQVLPRADVVVMSAAVADFTPARMSATKIKKGRAGLVLRLKPTVDILKALGEIKRIRRPSLVLIGFALETGSGRGSRAKETSRLAEARRKLVAKNLDAIVLDTPAEMGAESGAFAVLLADGTIRRYRLEKRRFAGVLVGLSKGCFRYRTL